MHGWECAGKVFVRCSQITVMDLYSHNRHGIQPSKDTINSKWIAKTPCWHPSLAWSGPPSGRRHDDKACPSSGYIMLHGFSCYLLMSMCHMQSVFLTHLAGNHSTQCNWTHIDIRHSRALSLAKLQLLLGRTDQVSRAHFGRKACSHKEDLLQLFLW